MWCEEIEGRMKTERGVGRENATTKNCVIQAREQKLNIFSNTHRSFVKCIQVYPSLSKSRESERERERASEESRRSSGWINIWLDLWFICISYPPSIKYFLLCRLACYNNLTNSFNVQHSLIDICELRNLPALRFSLTCLRVTVGPIAPPKVRNIYLGGSRF